MNEYRLRNHKKSLFQFVMIIAKYYLSFIRHAVVGNREIFSKTTSTPCVSQCVYVIFARHYDISCVLLGFLMLPALVASAMYKHYSSLSTLSPTIIQAEPPGRLSHHVGHGKVGGTGNRVA